MPTGGDFNGRWFVGSRVNLSQENINRIYRDILFNGDIPYIRQVSDRVENGHITPDGRRQMPTLKDKKDEKSFKFDEEEIIKQEQEELEELGELPF